MEGSDDHASLLSFKSVRASPDTLTKLVKRLRALTLKLLPYEVDPKSLSDPTSRIITPKVIAAFEAAAGDFTEALPYCLLRSRQGFMWDANHNPADYGENYGRAIACEVLARRVTHHAAPDRLTSIMSTRFRHREMNGDTSDLTSALELAIDTNCTIFLSSTEAQYVIDCLWRGTWVQRNNEHNDIDYVPFDQTQDPTFWDHLDPSRLCVPRYQNFFRITIWLVFLVVYSQAVRQPLNASDSPHQPLTGWELVMYIMGLSFSMEELHKLYKTLRFFTWRAFGFWTVISVMTDILLIIAFSLRITALSRAEDKAGNLHTQSFQVLSFVSPLIWMKLITIVDGYKYVGTMQICVARMLQESGIFFALLSILGIGFAQGLYALDAADGETNKGPAVIHALIQALLQSPDFGKPITSGTSLILYYLWNVATSVILLNILISLFSSAYQDVVDDAEAQYLAFFASKTVGMIRAPDSFVYPAPFNILEVFFIAPWEPFLSKQAYAKFNGTIMMIIFFVPLTVIALWETRLSKSTSNFLNGWYSFAEEGEEDNPDIQNPEIEDENGLTISRVPFSDLVRAFPNTQVSADTNILDEIQSLKRQMKALVDNLEKA